MPDFPAPGRIHLHALHATHQLARDVAPMLSSDERARAARHALPLLRTRWVAFRGGLRRVLATYLGVDAGALRFDYGPEGRPELLDAPRLRFNLTHADDAGLVAVAAERAVGVDLERARSGLDLRAMADIVFSEPERRHLARCRPAEREPAFFATWVRKEAFVKALGRGFSLDPRTFSTSDALAGCPGLASAVEALATDGWRLLDIDIPGGPAAGLHAAVCLERRLGDPPLCAEWVAPWGPRAASGSGQRASKNATPWR